LSHLFSAIARRDAFAMTRSLVALALVACGSAPVENRRFENDYAGARLEAKQRHLPLAVEVWAPW
jgi:hypothetical protein